jgi:hypothetical protein
VERRSIECTAAAAKAVGFIHGRKHSILPNSKEKK